MDRVSGAFRGRSQTRHAPSRSRISPSPRHQPGIFQHLAKHDFRQNLGWCIADMCGLASRAAHGGDYATLEFIVALQGHLDLNLGHECSPPFKAGDEHKPPKYQRGPRGRIYRSRPRAKVYSARIPGAFPKLLSLADLPMQRLIHDCGGAPLWRSAHISFDFLAVQKTALATPEGRRYEISEVGR